MSAHRHPRSGAEGSRSLQVATFQATFWENCGEAGAASEVTAAWEPAAAAAAQVEVSMVKEFLPPAMAAAAQVEVVSLVVVSLAELFRARLVGEGMTVASGPAHRAVAGPGTRGRAPSRR